MRTILALTLILNGCACYDGWGWQPCGGYTHDFKNWSREFTLTADRKYHDELVGNDIYLLPIYRKGKTPEQAVEMWYRDEVPRW